MKVLNNKVLFELIPQKNLDIKQMMQNPSGVLEYGKVLQVGSKVEDIKKGDIITVYSNDIRKYDGKCFCGENSVLFVNNNSRNGRTHLKNPKSTVSQFTKATVESTTEEGLEKGDEVIYLGTFIDLPDGSKLLNNSQIFSKV